MSDMMRLSVTALVRLAIMLLPVSALPFIIQFFYIMSGFPTLKTS